jgi:hypothetical protein
MAITFNDAQRQVATALGIKNPNSQNDLNQINAAASAAGIKNVNSSNDVAQITAKLSGGGGGSSAPASAAAPKPASGGSTTSSPHWTDAYVGKSSVDAGTGKSYDYRIVDTVKGPMATAGPRDDAWVQRFIEFSNGPNAEHAADLADGRTMEQINAEWAANEAKRKAAPPSTTGPNGEYRGPGWNVPGGPNEAPDIAAGRRPLTSPGAPSGGSSDVSRFAGSAMAEPAKQGAQSTIAGVTAKQTVPQSFSSAGESRYGDASTSSSGASSTSGSSDSDFSFDWRPEMGLERKNPRPTNYGQQQASVSSASGEKKGWDRYLDQGTSRFAGDKVRAFMGA